jgi:conjugal transfer pilus assembly protein TraL
MTDTDAFYMPKHLDEPERFLFWTIDEALTLIIPIFIGTMFKMFVVGIIISAISFASWRRLKGAGYMHALVYAMYWYLPADLMSMRYTPPSHQRIYLL